MICKCGHDEKLHIKDTFGCQATIWNDPWHNPADCPCPKFEPQETLNEPHLPEDVRKERAQRWASMADEQAQKYKRDRFWQVLCACLANGAIATCSSKSRSLLTFAMKLTNAALEAESKL